MSAFSAEKQNEMKPKRKAEKVQAFMDHLKKTDIAFIPKTDSNARKFRKERTDDPSVASADDDGVAIFWRRAAFEVKSINFLIFDDDKRLQGAVRARLQRKVDKFEFMVMTTHLTSGSGEKARCAHTSNRARQRPTHCRRSG